VAFSIFFAVIGSNNYGIVAAVVVVFVFVRAKAI